MDDDDYRRGRKTTHIVYGEDMGILAGDALLNYAFETACTAFEEAPEEATRIGKALQVLAKKAGIYGMIGGQVVDVSASGKNITEDILSFIYELKTGSAFRKCHDDRCDSGGSRRRGSCSDRAGREEDWDRISDSG